MAKNKKDLWKEWKEEWDRITLTKGKYYANLQQSTKINENPGTKISIISKENITTMNRLLSGHCCTPQHLFKIKIKETSNSSCGELDDLNHIFGCEQSRYNCDKLYHLLEKNIKVTR
ncbi:hypothetical protein HHI36_024333 [Cryptolaemus montrouzieri]|uniref:Uncharacterized protein n=1 Tax=Cryptolaemus montrouzieri TaxID=559131 RepID=A0ABD2NC52_9CUCU